MRITKSIKRFHQGRYSNMAPEELYGMELSRAELEKLHFIKRQLINSKGAVCGICGKPIEDMKDCTVDHIRPLSKGGMTTIDNCQLAHTECSVKKGNTYE
jgi:5-methylcytosine-specific restriction endonuclease McrA